MQGIEQIVILDFGSQYTQLIARRLREMHVYAEIVPPDIRLEKIFEKKPKGIIFSGGPGSTLNSSIAFDKAILDCSLPILGICYGMQLMNRIYKGQVKSLGRGEYGKQHVSLDARSALFKGLSEQQSVWMSHGESVETLAPCFNLIANSKDKVIAAIAHKEKPQYGLQFHPEVVHTEFGSQMIKNFIDICQCSCSWSMESYIEQAKKQICQQVGQGRVISFISGGVDSTVSTLLCFEALGKERVFPIHIDNGLMRKDESQQVMEMLFDHGITNVDFVDASKLFLNALKGVTDPEEKRKRIGNLFIEILDRELKKLKAEDAQTYLCQGTLYTDLIESGQGCGSQAAVIKSHHNVNPPFVEEKRAQGLVVEPNKYIFKDEVRDVAKVLKVPDKLALRHPFPGPGLAIRVMGEVTKERLNILREADAIYLEEIEKAGLYSKVWQAFAVLIPISTVGVMGDNRAEGAALALRAVDSKDGMTADFSPLPFDVLQRVSSRIINEVKGIARVVYDVTSKPPGTIEWE